MRDVLNLSCCIYGVLPDWSPEGIEEVVREIRELQPRMMPDAGSSHGLTYPNEVDRVLAV